MQTTCLDSDREIDRLVRDPDRRKFTGVSQATWYELISKGLAPPPVKLSRKCAVYPISELRAWNAARIAGKSEAEIKTLVKRLIAARARAFDRFETTDGAIFEANV